MPQRKSNPNRLVIEHLEDVSWRVLEEYPDVIRDMIRSKAGVYALYRKDRLYYVGLASNLMGRLRQHLRDRHNGVWDRFSVYLTVRDEHIKELESLLLRIVNPPGNRTSGKFSDSVALKRVLNREIAEADADRRARLLGGVVAKRRLRAKTKKDKKGTRALSGVVDKRLQLRAWYQGYEYKAALLKNGLISYDGRRFETPTAAAKFASKQARVNGWRFWHYRNADGKWVALSEIRK
jgi:hypothetical protein